MIDNWIKKGLVCAVVLLLIGIINLSLVQATKGNTLESLSSEIDQTLKSSIMTSNSNGIGFFVLHGRIINHGQVYINGYLCYNLTAIFVRGFYFHLGLPIPQITFYKYVNEPLYLYRDVFDGFVGKNYMFYKIIGYA